MPRSTFIAGCLLTVTSIALSSSLQARESPASQSAGLFDGAVPVSFLECESECATQVQGPCGEEGCTSASANCESCLTQPTLTGDWCGLRKHLQQSGIIFRGTVTQFAFGVEGGINRPVLPPLGQGDTFKYTGRGEYDTIFDLEKLGGPQKGKLLVGMQHWWGEFGNVSVNSGTFAPPVFAAALPPQPMDRGELFLTDFLYTQPISPGLVAFAGKKNVIGAADQDIFAGGDGTDQFMNQALIANPAYLLALPYSTFTAGAVMPHDWGAVSAFVFDATDRTHKGLDLDGLFSEGVIVGSEVKVKTRFFGKPGEHHLGGIWKHLDLYDLRAPAPAPGYPYPPVLPAAATIRDSWTIYYGFDQYVQVFQGKRNTPGPVKPPRGWGFFGRASISDANPTPIRYFLSGGIGGDSPFGDNRGDAFGLGWFYVDASNEFGPVAQATFGPQDGAGVELFYRFQCTPWLAITPDVQYVKPGLGGLTSGDNAFIYGVRVNIRL